MNEFKGTKGQWVANYQTGSWLIQDKEAYQEGLKGCLAEVYYFHDGKDTAEANALLISKAPEILKMLKDILSGMRGGNFEVTEYQIEQLIKEATELK